MAPFRASLLAALGAFQGKLALADVNVYGQPMTACGADHYGGCTYVAGDSGAHEVCVTKLPHGFSSNTGQGPWSDEYEGQPWCICIWAYSNYILQNKNLPLKCESIPSKVLEEQYSLDKFKECGSMASTMGCGDEDIRRSIESLCQQCDQQAGDPASKSALKAKCDSILASAPAVPLSRLYSVDDAPKAKGFLSVESKLGLPQFASGVMAVAIAGVFIGLVRRTSANFQRTSEGPTAIDDMTGEQFSREAFIE
jgi:hypothetical protein